MQLGGVGGVFCAEGLGEAMMTFMQAIARQEGFHSQFNPHNTPTIDHNPGDIEEGIFAQSHGALPPIRDENGKVLNRFARWATDEEGYAAMRALLLSAYVGLTVFGAISKWAPSVENSDDVYVKHVCDWTGLEPTTVLTAEIIG